MKWLIARLCEPSTWRGLVWLATVAGLTLSPQQAEAIITAGMALAGLLGVLLPEKPNALPPIDLQSVSAAADRMRVDVSAERPNEPAVPSNHWNG